MSPNNDYIAFLCNNLLFFIYFYYCFYIFFCCFNILNLTLLNNNCYFENIIVNNGYISLVSQQTKQAVGQLKMNGNVRSCAFNSDDSNTMLSFGNDGIVYIWDLRMMRCIKQFNDDG